MRQFQIASVSAAAFVLLAFVPGSRAQQVPEPQQIAQHCVAKVTARATHRVHRNHATAAQCTMMIGELLEQGRLKAAVHVAQHCVHRVVSSSHYTQMRNKMQCAHCIGILLELDAPGLAEVVGNACGEAAMAVGNSRQHAVQAILDALPRGEAAIVLSPCLADIDGDRAVGVTDFLDLVAAWGTDPEGPPDLDFDGVVTIHDMVVMVQAWGACPE